MWGMANIAAYAATTQAWVKKRLGERTTWDGTVIVAVCGSYIIFDSIITVGAYAGIIYGLWTIYQEQKQYKYYHLSHQTLV